MMTVMMMMMNCDGCSKVNFADAPPDNIVDAVLGSCHIADPTPPPPTLPTDGATVPLPTIPTGECLSIRPSVRMSEC